MIRELAMRSRRRRESDADASPPRQDPAPVLPKASAVRSFASLPRRLSRGPGSFHRSSSSVGGRPPRGKPPSNPSEPLRSSDSRRPRNAKAELVSEPEDPKNDKPRVFTKRPGVSQPLVTVDELFKWRPTGMAAKCVSRVPLSESAIKRYVRGAAATAPLSSLPAVTAASAARGAVGSLKRLQPPRLLLCHDFKGGYPDWEAAADGVSGDDCPPDAEMWRFNHWAYVDVFVYFSHYRVTIPPVGYIQAAHRHGSLCLGTLIFEWDAGAEDLMKILASFKTRSKAATQLAAIAKFYGFDGWLLNVEVPLKGGSSAASDLAAFIGDLTRAMRKIVGQISEVIWYDSVTRDGSLKWQNELNQDNEQFFKAAGSIFTNYHWDRNAPVRSAVKAGTRRTDVFTGIDIFGRNTYGGGGFHAHLALRAIKQGGTSAALFAPGWTVEKCPPNVKDPRDLEGRFWTGPAGRFGRESVAQYFKERAVLTEIPFKTSFDPGWGPRQMKNGKLVNDERYFNMSQQDIQPSFMRAYAAAGDTTAAELSLSQEQAFQGSSSMKTKFAFSESRMLSGSFTILRLFVASVSFPTRLSSRITESKNGLVRVSYDYLAMSDVDPKAAGNDFGLVLLFASPPGAVLLVGEDSRWNANKSGGSSRIPPRLQILGKFLNYEVCVANSDTRAPGAPSSTGISSGWMSRSYTLEGSLTSGQRLQEVMIVAGGPSQQPVSVRASPFMTPSASRSVSRSESRQGSRMGSSAPSRSGSPPRTGGYDGGNERVRRNRHPMSAQQDPVRSAVRSLRPDLNARDEYGNDLRSRYRDSSSHGRRIECVGAAFRRDVVGGGVASGFERRQDCLPGVRQRRLDGGMNDGRYSNDEMAPGHSMSDLEGPGGLGRMTYAGNFDVDGAIDFDNMEDEDYGMNSVSTSRALSRLGSRLQTPSGSRPMSRVGSRMGSLNASRAGSLAASLAGSRTGSLAGSLAGSRLGSRAPSRQGSRFGSPSGTPSTGGGGALPLNEALRRNISGLSSDRRQSASSRARMSSSGLGTLDAGSVADGAQTPQGAGGQAASLRDLKTALMNAAGSMAGEGGTVSGGSSAGSCIVYLGGLRIDLIDESDTSLPAVFH